MRGFVLGTFLLVEIAGILAYIAFDRAEDPASFDLDGRPFGDMLSQAYDDIAWSDLVRRSTVVQGNVPTFVKSGEFPNIIRMESGAHDAGFSAPASTPPIPLAGLSEAAFPPSVRDSQGVARTGQNR